MSQFRNSEIREIEFIVKAVKDHHKWYKDCLVMIASENVTSNTIKLLAATDLSHRYAEGKVGNRYYQGCKYIDLIEEKTIELAKKLFDAEHVNVQPVSGVTANMAGFFALTNTRDTIMSLDIPHGGHISHVEYSAAGIRDLNIVPHPFNNEEMNIDIDEMIKTIYKIKPNLILFGASLFLFPHPVKEARDAADEVGAKIMYDGAHVLGLIAGKKFQDPLKEGADVMTGSTHKTFPGPQGAMIFSTKKLADKIDRAVFPGVVSNHHLHHVAGLAVALAEMMAYGEAYASQVLKNAKALAQSLYERGFKVLCEEKGFTESHQIVLDVSDLGGGTKVALNLERANIITNKNLLPWDNIHFSKEPSGLRLGTQELTHIGMKESEMDEIADFFKRILINQENPENVKRDVINLKNNYQQVHYCFDGEGAYKFPDHP
ncbi:MAG: serine hydroxymethyltransferase [Methanosarcinales archaeon]